MKIPIKRFVDDPTKTWEERFAVLLKHHEEEAKWLIAKATEYEEALLFLRDGWSPVGARGCPACLYEDGVFIRSCKLHEEVDRAMAAGKELDEAIDILRVVEWEGGWGLCPACAGHPRDATDPGLMATHSPECRLGALLARHPTTP